MCGWWLWHIYLIWYVCCDFITRRVERLTSGVKLTLLDTNPVSFPWIITTSFSEPRICRLFEDSFYEVELLFYFGCKRLCFTSVTFSFEICYIFLKAFFFYSYHRYYNRGHNILGPYHIIARVWFTTIETKLDTSPKKTFYIRIATWDAGWLKTSDGRKLRSFRKTSIVWR